MGTMETACSGQSVKSILPFHNFTNSSLFITQHIMHVFLHCKTFHLDSIRRADLTFMEKVQQIFSLRRETLSYLQKWSHKIIVEAERPI